MRRACLLVAIFGLTSVWSACGDDDGTQAKPFFRTLPTYSSIAHRGGAGLYPEETLYAYEHAVADDHTDMLEIDLHLTSDGYIVLSHDDDVARTTDGTGLIIDLSLSELKALDAAYWFDPDDDQTYPLRGQGIQIATLEELFQEFPDQHYLLEIKDTDNEYEQDLYDLIVLYDMQDQVIFGSFIDESTERMRAIAPDLALYYPTTAATCFVVAVGDGDDPMTECTKHYDALSLPEGGISPELVDIAHANGIAVWVWTIDDRSFMEQLFDMGVDGIISDRPDILREVIDAL